MDVATFNENLWFAIAEPSRRKLVDILLARGESSASTLAKYVPFTRQAVTKHMGVLRQAGMVRQRKVGKEVLFSLEPAGMANATQELSSAASMWDAKLHRIKQLAEALENESAVGGRSK